MQKGGWSIIIDEAWDDISVKMHLNVAICNISLSKSIDLRQLGLMLERQLKRSYEMQYSKTAYQTTSAKSGLDGFHSKGFSKLGKKRVTVKLSVTFRIVSRPNMRFDNEFLLLIKDNKEDMVGIYGKVNHNGGTQINLNENIVSDIIKGRDNNTLSHEFGHSLGLYHVNQKITYDLLDARQYYPVARQRTKDSLNAMFSGDSRYMHDSTSTVITPRQMDIIIEKYRFGKLNR